MHDLRSLQRRLYFTRALTPICRGVLALCSETSPVHRALPFFASFGEEAEMALRFVPGSIAWLARGGNQINGKACRVAGGAARKEVNHEL